MKRNFKPNRKLRKKVKIFLYMFLIFPLIIIMQSQKILKPLFDKSVKNLFSYDEKYNSKIAKVVFSNVNINDDTSPNLKVNDDMFIVKEEKNTNPIIYLYNTHQGEKYKAFSGSDFTPTIITATKYLKEKFTDNGLNTIIENRSVNKVLEENNWSYGSSYRVSRSFINSVVENNPSIKYLFDIHRDSGTHEYTTLCNQEKCYARLLFLIGLENNDYLENQKYAEEISKRLNERVKGISKGILQKKGPKVNGVYNQDFSNRTMLIEIGGENNTLDEVYNSIDVLSDVLIEFIKEEI